MPAVFRVRLRHWQLHHRNSNLGVRAFRNMPRYGNHRSHARDRIVLHDLNLIFDRGVFVGFRCLVLALPARIHALLIAQHTKNASQIRAKHLHEFHLITWRRDSAHSDSKRNGHFITPRPPQTVRKQPFDALTSQQQLIGAYSSRRFPARRSFCSRVRCSFISIWSFAAFSGL